MAKEFVAKRWQTTGETAMQKAGDAMARFDDMINLSIGDTDFITDTRIIDGAMRDAKAGHTKYTNPQGDPELIAAVVKAYREDYAIELSPREVFVTTSSCMGMSLVMLAILDPEDEVLLLAPYFPVYRDQVKLAWGKPVEVPTYEAEDFAISEARLCAAITPKTKAIILNNPCNPTGAAYDAESYRIVARIAEEYNLLVIADEIYTEYLFHDDFVPFCTLPGMRERTITLNSFSKNYMMTGWRIGYLLAAPELVQTIRTINENLVYSAPSISQRAAIYALELRHEMKKLYIDSYQERVYYAADRINAIPKLSVRRPDGTFYLFMNITETGLTSSEFCDKMIDEAHVIFVPGNAFGAAGEGYVRIACTVSLKKLQEAFDRIEALSL